MCGGVGVFHIGVLQLLRLRLLSNIQHKSLIFYFFSEKPQIFRNQRLQHAHAARPIPKAVMRLKGNPAAVIAGKDVPRERNGGALLYLEHYRRDYVLSAGGAGGEEI